MEREFTYITNILYKPGNSVPTGPNLMYCIKGLIPVRCKLNNMLGNNQFSAVFRFVRSRS